VKYLLVLIVALAVLGGSVTPASGYLITKPKTKGTTDVYNAQLRNYAHNKYVCNNGAHRSKWWACKAVKWLGRELHESYLILHHPMPTRELQSASSGYAPGCGSSCVSCETGGTFDPQIVSPGGKYWGWYQFDYGTWVVHGGISSHYGNASSGEQTAIASRVRYDAWPNC
jgi:hypothetical protein